MKNFAFPVRDNMQHAFAEIAPKIVEFRRTMGGQFSRDCVKVPFYWAVFHRAGTRNRARVTTRRDWYSRPLPIGMSRLDTPIIAIDLPRPRDRIEALAKRNTSI